MKIIISFIIFAIFYGVFNWIIKRVNLHRKLFDNPEKSIHTKSSLVLILILFAFLVEYGQQLLNDLYGQHNYMSIVLAALLASIYMNFVPLMFKKNNS